MSLKNRKNKEYLANRKKLNEACMSGDLKTVEQLVGVVQNLNRPVDGETPLTMACRWNQPEVAEYLMVNGADVNSAITDEPPLHNAIRSRSRLMVQLLLKSGANPNARCKEFGHPALELALCMRRDDIAADLLNFGANIGISSKDGLALTQLLWFGGDELFHAVCRKPKWFAVTMPGGVPLLHSLAFWGGTKYVEQAGMDGADINAFSEDSMPTTPLHQACANGGGRTVRALLDLGADTDARDGKGYPNS